MRHLALLALAACGNPAGITDTADIPAVDARFTIPAPPEGGLQWVLPDAVIPPSTDSTRCYVDSYDGEDIGVNTITTYQAEGYGHHLLFWTGDVDPELYPDGSVFDCGNPATMSGWMPLFVVHPDRIEGGAVIAMSDLPDGMGISLDGGTRLIIQTHYLNTTPDPLLVRDAVNFAVLPEAEVEVWAAAWGHGVTDMPVPPGESSLAFDCTWAEDVNLLWALGHMHQRGTALSLDHVTPGGTTRIYDVPEWDPAYRDTPPLLEWDMPGYPVAAGDVFTTRCAWFNETDTELNYPDEMCATTGIAWPSKIPIICNPMPAE
ncbi:MAG: hypothetical protein Q8P18_11415 [Pseudomonadota bacterium]|nr:hypothetical protein [Pseudomonadota bacterium]